MKYKKSDIINKCGYLNYYEYIYQINNYTPLSCEFINIFVY
jgi:hypothetical protein